MFVSRVSSLPLPPLGKIWALTSDRMGNIYLAVLISAQPQPQPRAP
jgi:hypothetical protein